MRYKNDDGTINEWAQKTIDNKKARLSYFSTDKYETGDQATEALQIRAPKPGRDHERFLSKFRRFDLQIEL